MFSSYPLSLCHSRFLHTFAHYPCTLRALGLFWLFGLFGLFGASVFFYVNGRYPEKKSWKIDPKAPKQPPRRGRQTGHWRNPVIRNGLVSVFHRDLMARCPHFSPGRDVWSCLIRSEARQVWCRIWSCFHPKQTNQSNETSMKVQIQIQMQIVSFAAGISSFDTTVIDQGGGAEQMMTLYKEGGQGSICKCWQTIAYEWMGVSTRWHHGWALEYWLIEMPHSDYQTNGLVLEFY